MAGKVELAIDNSLGFLNLALGIDGNLLEERHGRFEKPTSELLSVKVRQLISGHGREINDDDLSGYDIVVTSIYGTLDGLSTGNKIDASRPLLLDATTWVAIEGGNHAQFGDYGVQAGDNLAAITAEEQQARAAEATLAVLQAIADEAP